MEEKHLSDEGKKRYPQGYPRGFYMLHMHKRVDKLREPKIQAMGLSPHISKEYF